MPINYGFITVLSFMLIRAVLDYGCAERERFSWLFLRLLLDEQ